MISPFGQCRTTIMRVHHDGRLEADRSSDVRSLQVARDDLQATAFSIQRRSGFSLSSEELRM